MESRGGGGDGEGTGRSEGGGEGGASLRSMERAGFLLGLGSSIRDEIGLGLGLGFAFYREGKREGATRSLGFRFSEFWANAEGEGGGELEGSKREANRKVSGFGLGPVKMLELLFAVMGLRIGSQM